MKYEPLVSNSYYHIYNCGNNKEDIFIEEKNYSYFLKLTKKYILPVAHIWSYCLLKNHFHILLKTKEGIEDKIISQSFSNLFNAYAKAINKSYNRNGSLFKDRFSRIKILNENYLKALLIYINTNAVHHGFTEKTECYRHSSYLGLISDKTTLLEREEVMSLFGCKTNFIHVIHQQQNIIKEITLE